jgi:hypothetical protein
VTITPAYGRDYTSKKAVLSDFDAEHPVQKNDPGGRDIPVHLGPLSRASDLKTNEVRLTSGEAAAKMGLSDQEDLR